MRRSRPGDSVRAHGLRRRPGRPALNHRGQRVSGLRRRGRRDQRRLTTSRATCCAAPAIGWSTTRTQLDWSLNPALEAEVFTSSTTYDALNRPVMLTTPDDSGIHRHLQRSQPAGAGRGEPARRGQRHSLRQRHRLQREGPARARSNTATAFERPTEYDPLTFRLTRLLTTRSRGHVQLQDLSTTPTTRPATSPTSATTRSRRSTSTTRWSSRTPTTPTTRSIA